MDLEVLGVDAQDKVYSGQFYLSLSIGLGVPSGYIPAPKTRI